MDLAGLTLEDALYTLGIDSASFAVMRSDRLMIVANDTPQQLREYLPIAVRSFPVRYHDPDDLKRALGILLMSEHSLVADPESATLLVRAGTGSVCAAERLVELLDRPPAEIDLAIRLIALPPDDVPRCHDAPCGKIPPGSLPGGSVWSVTATVIGDRRTSQRATIPLPGGSIATVAVEARAHHLSALGVVELEVQVEADVGHQVQQEFKRLSSSAESTIRLAPGEAHLVPLTTFDQDVALLLSVEPIVRRPDPWAGADPLELAEGTTARLTSTSCARPAAIP